MTPPDSPRSVSPRCRVPPTGVTRPLHSPGVPSVSPPHLYRSCRPPPQVALQGPHWLQRLQAQVGVPGGVPGVGLGVEHPPGSQRSRPPAQVQLWQPRGCPFPPGTQRCPSASRHSHSAGGTQPPSCSRVPGGHRGQGARGEHRGAAGGAGGSGLTGGAAAAGFARGPPSAGHPLLQVPAAPRAPRPAGGQALPRGAPRAWGGTVSTRTAPGTPPSPPEHPPASRSPPLPAAALRCLDCSPSVSPPPLPGSSRCPPRSLPVPPPYRRAGRCRASARVPPRGRGCPRFLGGVGSRSGCARSGPPRT